MSYTTTALKVPQRSPEPPNNTADAQPQINDITASPTFPGAKRWVSTYNSTVNHPNVPTNVDANCKCHCFNSLPIFHPVGPFKCVWDVIVVIMLIYSCIEIPFLLSFSYNLTLASAFGILSFTSDIFLCCDILVSFRTAYFDRFDTLKLITNPDIIAKKYVRDWFIIDCISSLPVEFIIPYTFEQGDFDKVAPYVQILRIFRLSRVIRIVRIFKIMALFNGVMRRMVQRDMLFVARLLKILVFMLLCTHWFACLWYFIGCESNKSLGVSWISEFTDLIHSCDADSSVNADDVSPLFIRYSFAFYWSVVTLFTTGYGDITATNVHEQWVASICILIGTCFFAYFIGTLTYFITEGDRIASETMSRMEEAQHFCDMRRIPREMRRAVLAHTRYHCNYNCVLDEHSVLRNLPPYLQTDVALHTAKNLMLSNVYFLNESILDPVVIGSIAMRTRSISCNNGYQLYKEGDLGKELYIQRTGRSMHLVESKKGKKKKIELNRGDICGEYSLILKKRASTVLCATWCEFYVIQIDDIMEVLQQHYGDGWRHKWAKMKKIVKTEYSKPSRWRKKRFLKNVESYEGEMHGVWSDKRRSRRLMRSTISASDVLNNRMSQNVLNDSDHNCKYPNFMMKPDSGHKREAVTDKLGRLPETKSSNYDDKKLLNWWNSLRRSTFQKSQWLRPRATRLNSVLRDKVVLSDDAVNIDSFQQMFSEYQSDRSDTDDTDVRESAQRKQKGKTKMERKKPPNIRVDIEMKLMDELKHHVTMEKRDTNDSLNLDNSDSLLLVDGDPNAVDSNSSGSHPKERVYILNDSD